MPTITATIHCMPKYYPEADGSEEVMAQVALDLAAVMPQIVSNAINSVDRRDTSAGGNAIEKRGVSVPFRQLNPNDVNAPEVLVVVNPPEVDATFEERQIRRTRLEWFVRQEIDRRLGSLPEILLPHLEVEIICVESTGSGTDARGQEIYSWGRYDPNRAS